MEVERMKSQSIFDPRSPDAQRAISAGFATASVLGQTSLCELARETGYPVLFWFGLLTGFVGALERDAKSRGEVDELLRMLQCVDPVKTAQKAKETLAELKARRREH